MWRWINALEPSSFTLCWVCCETKVKIQVFTTHNPSRLSREDQNHTAHVELPADLVRLEAHFEKPPRVHNDDRLRRKELSQLHADLSDPKKCADVLRNARCDGRVFALEHVTELPHGRRKIMVQKETAGLCSADVGVAGVEHLSLEDNSRAGDVNCYCDCVWSLAKWCMLPQHAEYWGV